MRSGNHHPHPHLQPQPFPNGCQTMRTPVAWYQRDVHLMRPSSREYSAHQLVHSINPRTSSPSLTTTSSDDREEIPMVRHHARRPNRQPNSQTVDRRSVISRMSRTRNVQQNFSPAVVNSDGPMMRNGTPINGPPMNVLRTGTLRSSRSVPGFLMSMNTWDGEPCPVHGGHSHGNVASPMPMGRPPPMPMNQAPVPLPVKRFSSVADLRGNASSIFPMVTIVPPTVNGERPKFVNGVPMPQRSMFVPAFADMGQCRDALKMPPHMSSLLTSKLGPDNYGSEDGCCKGHLIVLWIILAVVTIGVISGIILGVTVN